MSKDCYSKEATTTYIPWHEATYFGRGAFEDAALTAHGWGCTDLTQRPRPFSNNPNRAQIVAGWRRIERDWVGNERRGGGWQWWFRGLKIAAF